MCWLTNFFDQKCNRTDERIGHGDIDSEQTH
jgi:hypothetical protein